MSKTDYLRATDRVRPGSGGGSVTLTGGGGGDAQTLGGYTAMDFLRPSYLTLSNDANLRNERVLTPGSGLEGTDAGANAAYTLAVKLKVASGLETDSSGLALSNTVAGAGLDITAKVMSVNAGAGLGISGDDVVVNVGVGLEIVSDAVALATPGTLSVTSANAATAPHSHAVTSSANPGAAASLLASSAAGYLQLVRLGIAVAPGYPLQAQGTTPQLRLQQDASNYSDFGVDAGGDLTVTPSGDSFLLPAAKTLSSNNWMSQTTGWGIYPESTYGRSGYADFRYLYADELHVKAFIADLEQALAGGQIIAKSVAIIAADFTIPAKGSSATLTVEDLPGTTAAVFVSGDWIRIRNISRSGGSLVVADAYGTVGSATLNGDGTQSYTFSRPAGDTGSAAGGTVVLKGGLAIDYGVSGNGYWEVTTLDPAGSPYAQVATWATHPQNLTVRLRLGNLDGIAGIGAEWGLWAGRSSSQYIKVSDAGAVLQGLTQTWIDSAGNARGMVDPSAGAGDYLFWLGPSSGDKRFAVTGAGTVYIGSVPSSNIAGWAHASDLTKIDGGDIYAGSITLSGLDPWGEVAGQNLLLNSSFAEDSNNDGRADDWSVGTGGTITGFNPGISADACVYDGLSQRLEGVRNDAANNAYVQAYQTFDFGVSGAGFPPGKKFTVSLWVWRSASDGDNTYTGLFLRAENSAGTYIADFASDYRQLPKSQWVRMTCTGTAPANTRRVGLLLRHYIHINGQMGCVFLDGATLNVGEYPIAWSAAQRGSVFIDGTKIRVGTRNGARIEINSAEVAGYSDLTTKQFYIRASDGKGMFGGGKGVLDSSGLSILGGTDYSNESSIRFMNAANNTLYGRICAIGTGTLFFQAPQGHVYFQTSLSAGAFATVNCGGVNLNGALNLYHSVGYAALSYNNSTGIVTVNKPLTAQGNLYLNVSNPTLQYNASTLYIQNTGYAHQVVSIRPGGSASGVLFARLVLSNASASATPTYTERIQLHTNGDTFFNGGNVAIGRVDASHRLHVYDGGNCQVHVHATGQAGYSIQNSVTSANFYLPSSSSEISFFSASWRQMWINTSGNAYKRDNTSTWSTTSDGNLKRDIADLRDALGAIRKLKPRTYRWTEDYRPDDRSEHVGFIAQEWGEVFPDHVTRDDAGNLTMNLGPIHEYLVAAIIEIDARLSVLEARSERAA